MTAITGAVASTQPASSTQPAPSRSDQVAAESARIASLAQGSMAEGFVEWAQRMTAHYLRLAETPNPRITELLDAVHTRHRPGCTAMAGAFKDVVGVAELGVVWEEDADGIRLDGFIPWASHLAPGAVMVTGARHATTGQRIVVVLEVDQAGVEVNPMTDLLALNETYSGTVSLRDVRIPLDQVVHRDLPGFARQIRTTFLALQSSFCLGLVTASLAASQEILGIVPSASPQSGHGTVPVAVAVFTEECTAATERAAALQVALDQVIAGITDAPAGPDEIAAALRVRLEAAVLAREVTQLELCVSGGRGYVASSPTARRLREAMFLPVQSPTEGQLRWELTRCA